MEMEEMLRRCRVVQLLQCVFVPLHRKLEFQLVLNATQIEQKLPGFHCDTRPRFQR